MNPPRARTRWLPGLGLGLALLSGCADPVEVEDGPDASVAPDASAAPDAGLDEPDGGFRVQSINLAPAGGEARSEDHRVTGGLVPAAGIEAASDRHRLRGRLGILAP
jgi:hypothetical protein